jgi:hypothetical protein
VPPLVWLLAALVPEQAPVANAAGVVADRTARPACPVEAGARRHDGFFARSEPGVAVLFASVRDEGDAPRRSAVRGVGQSAALSLGGTPLPGWVVGGKLWTARIDPVFHEGNATLNPDDDSVKLTVLEIGPFVDWYPDPRRGFHAFASSAFAIQIESDTKGNPREPPAFGGSLGLGVGHEWFLASEFSLGATLRSGFGFSERAPSDGREHMLFAVQELALSATYH